MSDSQNQQGFPDGPHFRRYNQKDPMETGGRSQTMTTAAVILSIIGISTVCCFYLSFVCSALGILFALLSKGGEMTMSQNAKMALGISAAAIVFAVVLLAVSLLTLIIQYGSIDAFWKAYLEIVQSYSAGIAQ